MAIVDLVLPKLGESIMEATILKWSKKQGDNVQQDETILEIATDKVDSEVPSTTAGVITEILFKENDVVPIGTVIARIETNGSGENTTSGASAAAEAPIAASPVQPGADTQEPIPFVPQSSAVTQREDNAPGNNGFFSPLVLNIAQSEGISMTELSNLTGSGNEGRVTKKDILQYVAEKKSGKVAVQAKQPYKAPDTSVAAAAQSAIAPAAAETPEKPQPSYATPTGNVEIIEMDRMRKMIAKHMVSSKQISPHVTSFAEADVTNMVMWRERVRKDFEKQEGTKITFTPMFVSCLTRVIKRFPIINCSVDGERIIIKKDINIGMATALPSGNLIVPVIKNADYLNLVGLSKQVNSLANSARNNKLKPDDTNGGTFTLTNVGTFGSLMGTPIINQPQVAILAVGAIKKRPVVIETAEGDAIGIRHMMYLSMSYDHRVVDGSIGASFLTEVAKEFERWDINSKW
ncbi:MAG: dihydrolipoamide acyltransferase component of branched-chain alpha-keto acid dehydrogenase complex [Segetibacter sp.]|nr:dihydrolipoamide acyltransferase component of branched-chain alpha-keto acid dehydrogenase complex [Segetibacter sp.]